MKSEAAICMGLYRPMGILTTCAWLQTGGSFTPGASRTAASHKRVPAPAKPAASDAAPVQGIGCTHAIGHRGCIAGQMVVGQWVWRL